MLFIIYIYMYITIYPYVERYSLLWGNQNSDFKNLSFVDCHNEVYLSLGHSFSPIRKIF